QRRTGWHECIAVTRAHSILRARAAFAKAERDHDRRRNSGDADLLAGRGERFAEIAAEFVRLKVDVILTHNTPPTIAAKQATSVIPIVFATAGDPVGSGIVASLPRPGGNITGLSGQAPDTAGKRIELLREIVPGLRRLAILADVGNPFTDRDIGEVDGAARALALEVEVFEIRRAEDIGPAFKALQGRAQALYV